MDKKRVLASYNNWKQSYKHENEMMDSIQDLEKIESMALQISYSRKVPKGQLKLPNFVLQSRKRNKLRDSSYSMFPSFKPKRLFSIKKREKVTRDSITVLPTIIEMDDRNNVKPVDTKTASESAPKLLDVQNISTPLNTRNKNNEKTPMTYWEKVAYERFCSEEPRLYFVYISIFVILACALTASISAVQYVYQKYIPTTIFIELRGI